MSLGRVCIAIRPYSYDVILRMTFKTFYTTVVLNSDPEFFTICSVFKQFNRTTVFEPFENRTSLDIQILPVYYSTLCVERVQINCSKILS
jgi:hypothetical protein